MVTITALWLPVLLAAFAAFMISFVTHQLIPLHRGDYGSLPDEAAVRAAIRAAETKPGDYVFPHCEPKAMNTPEMQKKWVEGPNGVMTVLPSGPIRMGTTLASWFAYLVVIYVFVAYLAGRTLGADAPYLDVFRVVGTVAFIAHAGAEPVMSIWFGRRWSTSIKNMFDGLLYALVAGGLFGWLWP